MSLESFFHEINAWTSTLSVEEISCQNIDNLKLFHFKAINPIFCDQIEA